MGLDSTGNRLLFLSSEADIEEVIPVKRRFLKRCHFYIQYYMQYYIHNAFYVSHV